MFDAYRDYFTREQLMAAIAKAPIQLPTKMESTKMFRDITKIPMAAGTDCFTKSWAIGAVPSSFDATLAMGLVFVYPNRYFYFKRMCKVFL
jgi:hypothetical protein